MRIGFHIAQLGGGGAERVIVLLANYFATNNHEVYVFANRPCQSEYLLDSSIEKFYLDEADCENGGFLVRNIARCRIIRGFCKTKKIEYMISFMAEPNFRAIASCMGLKTKNIVSVRNDPEKEYPGSMLSIARVMFRYAASVVVQTNSAADYFKSSSGRVCVIPNPVSDQFYVVTRNCHSKRIVTAGRLEKQKNQALLINAFALIADKHEEYTLDIFGVGSLEKCLKDQVDELGLSSRVIFHGSTPSMSSELSDAAVFVMSSDYEGMPNALMEAMAAGLPVVSTDCPCGGPADLIEDGRNGLLVSVGDTYGMGKAIDSIISESDFASSISREAKRAMEKYRTERICAKWAEVLGLDD